MMQEKKTIEPVNVFLGKSNSNRTVDMTFALCVGNNPSNPKPAKK